MNTRISMDKLILDIENTPMEVTCLPGTVIDREWKKKCSCGQDIYWEQDGEDWSLFGAETVVENRWFGDEYDGDVSEVDVLYCLGCDKEIWPGRKSDGKGFFREFIAGPTYCYLNGVEITMDEARNVICVMEEMRVGTMVPGC